MTPDRTRRGCLRLAAASLPLLIAGCLQDGDGSPVAETDADSPAATPPGTATRTQAQGLGTIEFAVTNEDDVTHRLEVHMVSVDGRTVLETAEPELEPGATVSAGSAGEPPENSPFTLTFRTDAAAAEYVWAVEECERINLVVTITDEGTVDIERDLCQN